MPWFRFISPMEIVSEIWRRLVVATAESKHCKSKLDSFRSKWVTWSYLLAWHTTRAAALSTDRRRFSRWLGRPARTALPYSSRVIMSDVTNESSTAWLTDLRMLRSRCRAAKQLETVFEMWVFIDTSLSVRIPRFCTHLTGCTISQPKWRGMLGRWSCWRGDVHHNYIVHQMNVINTDVLWR